MPEITDKATKNFRKVNRFSGRDSNSMRCGEEAEMFTTRPTFNKIQPENIKHQQRIMRSLQAYKMSED